MLTNSSFTLPGLETYNDEHPKKKKNKLKESLKKYKDSKINESAAIGVGAIMLTGGIIGGLLTKIYKDSKEKYMRCDNIKEPILRNKCYIGVLEGLISQIQASKSTCKNSADPAQCELELLEKINKLRTKQTMIMNKNNQIIVARRKEALK